MEVRSGKENRLGSSDKFGRPSAIPRRTDKTTLKSKSSKTDMQPTTARHAGGSRTNIRDESTGTTGQLRRKKDVGPDEGGPMPAASRGAPAKPPTPGTTRKKMSGDSMALLAFTHKQAEEAQAAEAQAANAVVDTDDLPTDTTKTMKVYVRVRPVEDKNHGLPQCLDLHCDDEQPAVVVHDSRPGVQPKKFAFNRVFNGEASNEEVYEATCKPLLDAVMNGFNGTLLAYGQTGSGKTHTMGSMATYDPSKGYQSAVRGMIPLVIENTFARISRDTKHKYKVCFSYVQIYQDEVYDLLCPDASLNDPIHIREHPDKGVYLEGISEFVVQSPAEVNSLLGKGRRRLVVAETKMNRHSSRSHALCFVSIECLLEKSQVSHEDPLAKKDLLVKGKITLCDLAGSERIKKSESKGERLAEAQHINSSLHELGNVVSSLANPEHTHVPFRNCALTRILQESLGGNCKTSLIVCASPLMKDESETKGTLGFGQRAMCVVQNARINVQLDYRHLANELARQLEHKEDIWAKLEAKLRRKIASLEKSHGKELTDLQTHFSAAMSAKSAEIESLKNGISATKVEIVSQHRAEMENVQQELRIHIENLERNEKKLRESARAQATKAAQDMAQRRKDRKQTEAKLKEELSCAQSENSLLGQLVRELETNIESLQEQIQASIEAEQSAGSEALSNANAAAAEVEEDFEQYRVDMQATVAELQDEIYRTREAQSVAVSTIEQQYSMQMSEAEQKHVSELEELSAQIETLKGKVGEYESELNKSTVHAEIQTDSATKHEISVGCEATPADFMMKEVSNLLDTSATSMDVEPEMLKSDSSSKGAWVENPSPTPYDEDTGFPSATHVVRKKKRGFLCCSSSTVE